jgi:hypothetical protein
VPCVTAFLGTEKPGATSNASGDHRYGLAAFVARNIDTVIARMAFALVVLSRAFPIAEVAFSYEGRVSVDIGPTIGASNLYKSHTKNLLFSGWHFLLREIHSQTGGRTEHKALYANRQSISLSNVIIA